MTEADEMKEIGRIQAFIGGNELVLHTRITPLPAGTKIRVSPGSSGVSPMRVGELVVDACGKRVIRVRGARVGIPAIAVDDYVYIWDLLGAMACVSCGKKEWALVASDGLGARCRACRGVLEELARRQGVGLFMDYSHLEHDQLTPELVQRWRSGSVSSPQLAPPPDPLDVEIDGVNLRFLIAQDRSNSQEYGVPCFLLTPAQRAAVSAHRSAQLRAKVAASDVAEAERERNRVVVDMEDW